MSGLREHTTARHGTTSASLPSDRSGRVMILFEVDDSAAAGGGSTP